MKNNSSILRHYRLIVIIFALCSIGFCLSATADAAVGLTITPTSVNNTYTGNITFQITGLASGAQVRLEIYLDVNGNGVIDTGEPLVQSFLLTDGQVTSFGGVRDINVPGDDDGTANRQITTHLSLPAMPEGARVAAQYLVRISSPTSQFTAFTQTLTVTQTSYLQQIKGTITSGGSPVPYAWVDIFDDVSGEMILGAMADALGNFSLNTPTGTFMVIGLSSGYVINSGSTATVTLFSGATITKSLTVTAATRTISGQLTDVATGAGLPGMQMAAKTSGGQIGSMAFTDASGNFTVPVTSGAWVIGGNSNGMNISMTQHGYVTPQIGTSVDASSGNVSGVSIQVPKETALIYGNVKDNASIPLANIDLISNDSANMYFLWGMVTDASGNYTMGVVAGTWNVGFDNNAALAGYIPPNSSNVTVAAGQAVQANFTVSPTSFAQWQLSNFDSTTATNAQPTATPANDGIPNLIKYALGANPFTPSSTCLPVATVATDPADSLPHLTLTANLNPGAADVVTVIAEVSSDLKTWNSGTGYTEVVSDTTFNGVRTVVFRDTTSLGAGVKRFIRLKVTLP